METPVIEGFTVNDMFCANPDCVLNIPHNGMNWATVRDADGTERLLDRHPMGNEHGKCYCTACRMALEDKS